MNSLVILLSGILLLALLLVVFYDKLFIWNTESTILLQGPETIAESFTKTISLAKIINNKRNSIMIPGYGNGLTFKWSMYLDDPAGEHNWHSSYTRDKPILTIGDSPHIYYNPKYNTLKIMLKYNETPFYAHYPIIELKDIPLRRWNTYVVCIDGLSVKVWMNDVIRLSKVLPNQPIISTSDIILGERDNNIQGALRDFVIYFRPYSTVEIQKRIL
jgi:hypothetical protein